MMKIYTLLIIILLSAASFAQDLPKIAVYVTGDVPGNDQIPKPEPAPELKPKPPWTDAGFQIPEPEPAYELKPEPKPKPPWMGAGFQIPEPEAEPPPVR